MPDSPVLPTTRSSFTSTIWNMPGKAAKSTNLTRYGLGNQKIMVGSKIRFEDGALVWDVARIFDDGTLMLTTISNGRKMKRKIPPTSASWTNLWLVDGKQVNADNSPKTGKKMGGGPNRNIDPGNAVLLGNSRVQWIVTNVLRDGTLFLASGKGDRVVNTSVGPRSKLWNSIYVAN